jgi:hypothetical protein
MNLDAQVRTQYARSKAVPETPRTASTIELPELRYIEKQRIGIRFCLLAPARTYDVDRVTTHRISAKRQIELFHLSNGEVVAIAEKRLSSIPGGVTAVLIREPGRKPKWQWHARLTDFQQRFKADPKAVAAKIEASWRDGFRFKTEIADKHGNVAKGDKGLRPPQAGALHNIGGHWSAFAHVIRPH